MNVENIQSQMRKGYLEYCILLILNKKPAYASDIISELKNAKMIVVEGTLYPLLTRLKNAELLDYRWEESTQGPPRKYYEVTPKGEKFINELDNAWQEINLVIDKIKEKHAV
jgi:PadR family transcriptional regulator PadR